MILLFFILIEHLLGNRKYILSHKVWKSFQEVFSATNHYCSPALHGKLN